MLNDLYIISAYKILFLKISTSYAIRNIKYLHLEGILKFHSMKLPCFTESESVNPENPEKLKEPHKI